MARRNFLVSSVGEGEGQEDFSETDRMEMKLPFALCERGGEGGKSVIKEWPVPPKYPAARLETTSPVTTPTVC